MKFYINHNKLITCSSPTVLLASVFIFLNIAIGCGTTKTMPISLTDFDVKVKEAGLKSFPVSRDIFQAGSIVVLDQEGNITKTPAGSLKECLSTDGIQPKGGKGISGSYLSSLDSGISLNIGFLEKLLPFLHLGAGKNSVGFIILQVPGTFSTFIGSIAIDTWVHDNWTAISKACLSHLLKPSTEVITEIIYAKNYSLTFYNLQNQKIELTALNVKGFIDSDLTANKGRMEAGKVFFDDATLPLLYTTYKPVLPKISMHEEEALFRLSENEKNFFGDVMTHTGIIPGGEVMRRMDEKSYKISRVVNYVIHGNSVYAADEISGEWVKDTPLTLEFVLGIGTTGKLTDPVIYDNNRKIALKPHIEQHGKTELYWIPVGHNFSITQTHTSENAFCKEGNWDFVFGVNRFKFLESYEVRVYLDRQPTFMEAYRVDPDFIPHPLNDDSKKDLQFQNLQKTLSGLQDEQFRSKIDIGSLKEGTIFFKKQIPPKGLFVIRVACL